MINNQMFFLFFFNVLKSINFLFVCFKLCTCLSQLCLVRYADLCWVVSISELVPKHGFKYPTVPFFWDFTNFEVISSKFYDTKLVQVLIEMFLLDIYILQTTPAVWLLCTMSLTLTSLPHYLNAIILSSMITY